MRRLIAALMIIAGATVLIAGILGGKTQEESAGVVYESVQGVVVRVDTDDVDGRLLRTVYVQSDDGQGNISTTRVDDYGEDVEIGARVEIQVGEATTSVAAAASEPSTALRVVMLLLIAAGVALLVVPERGTARKKTAARRRAAPPKRPLNKG